MQEHSHNVEPILTSVSVASAGAGWGAWLTGANEILVTISTIIAIVSGLWSLHSKWKLRGNADDDKTNTS